MKKAFCAILAVAVVLSSVAFSVFAISDSKASLISTNCDKIKTSLVNLQHADSRARVYLGRYYESILNNYIVPLNMRLVENNITDTDSINNQAEFSAKRQEFINDYITYQQGLEDLVATNCKDNPEGFYDKLIQTRAKQKNVSNDVIKLRNLVTKQINVVKELVEDLK